MCDAIRYCPLTNKFDYLKPSRESIDRLRNGMGTEEDKAQLRAYRQIHEERYWSAPIISWRACTKTISDRMYLRLPQILQE